MLEAYIPPAMLAPARSLDVVAIQPIGEVEPGHLWFARRVVNAVFGLRTTVLPAVRPFDDWHDARRRQWDADRMLDGLFAKMPGRAHRIVGLVDEDMFAADRTFVFGYAHLRDGMAVVSTARLRESWYGRPDNEQLLRSRLYRTLVHEIGHTFGRPHCKSRCVMHTVSHVDTLDTLAPEFCEPCMKRVREEVAVRASTAEGAFRRAGALLRRRFPEAAVALYERAVAQRPVARYLNDYGVALLAVNDLAKAEEVFRQATAKAAAMPHPYYNLGILVHERGDKEARDAFLAKGIEVDPDKAAAHRYVGKLYRELWDDHDRAESHLREANRLGAP